LATQPAAPADTPEVDLRTITTTIFDWLDVGYGVLASAVGFATYVTVALAIIAFCFYFFVWKFERLKHWFVPFIPLSHRQRTLDILAKMDGSISGFIRGRLLQSTVIAVVLSVGWWLAGVPYYLLLGIGGGLLNLIPYFAIVAWPLAILATGLASFDQNLPALGLGFWEVFFFPTLVYLIAQGLDGWVIEPWVQGKATNLEPVTVLLAVLIGGSLAGLLGMLIAIPTAACLRILAQEVVLPELRQWAADV
jgi:predicted PurR-regulated permease PerM